jgi:hypothetical protein
MLYGFLDGQQPAVVCTVFFLSVVVALASRDKPPSEFSTYKNTTSLLNILSTQSSIADALSRRPYRKESTHCHKVEAQADIKQVQAIAAVDEAKWDPAALRREQLNGQNIGLVLEEVQT